jgi:hypothetical protein
VRSFLSTGFQSYRDDGQNKNINPHTALTTRVFLVINAWGLLDYSQSGKSRLSSGSLECIDSITATHISSFMSGGVLCLLLLAFWISSL